MLSLAAETAERQLVESFARSLRELRRLRVRAQRMRAQQMGDSPSWVNRRLLVFPASALDQLCAVLDEGCKAIERRLSELRPGAVTEETSGSAVVAPGLSTTYDPRALLIAYRACGRALCASLAEARRISDASTAAMLSTLVYRLEKQLWLLDVPVCRERIGLPTIARFLSC